MVWGVNQKAGGPALPEFDGASSEQDFSVNDQSSGRVEVGDYSRELLKALVAMARTSSRQQAELWAAIKRARLQTDPVIIDGALRRLEDQRYIRNMIPLYDGGLVITVTSLGFDTPILENHWSFLERIRDHSRF